MAQSGSAAWGRPGWYEPEKAVDPHKYLLGRERAIAEDKEVLGRTPGDAEQLFPKYTTAEVAATGQMNVGGKTLNVWTYSQLEPLSQRVLRERATAIRDAVGEANCPPMPSTQHQDLVRWIVHMQSEITQDKPQVGRGGFTGTAHAVPKSFTKESQERPLAKGQVEPDYSKSGLPFGPRAGHDHGATRDNFRDLVRRQPDVDPEALRLGIVTNRNNGEGRRHLFPDSNMVTHGVSASDELPANGGRRYMGCKDNMMEQKKEMEAWDRDPRAAALANALQAKGGPRSSNQPVTHVSESHLTVNGRVAESYADAPIGGERRRHAPMPDRMMCPGVADPGADEGKLAGRKHLDGFAGSKFDQSAQSGGYQSNWKKDPSNLRGTSMIC